MYSYSSANCHRAAEGDGKTTDIKCLVPGGSTEVEWSSFDTYLEPQVMMGQMNLNPDVRTQFSNSDGFCYANYNSAEVPKVPNVLAPDLAHERHGLMMNPGNCVATNPVHKGYAYDSSSHPCSSGLGGGTGGGFQQGNDLIRRYVPPFTSGVYDPGYQAMGGHPFSVPPSSFPPPHPSHSRHSAEPSDLEMGCPTAARDDSHFLHALSLNDEVAQSGCDEYPSMCYGGDLSNMHAPQPPFIKSPASSVSLMDISQSHLDDGLHHEVVRRRRRREQNRVAARKCREKKKENVDNMLKDYTETMKENERLRLETEKLQTLVARLQTIVKSHQTTCNFSSAL